MDERDGELSLSDNEVYNPISRPVESVSRIRPLSDLSDDDLSSYESDSSMDLPNKKRKCVSSAQRSEIPKQIGVKKRNTIWTDILQEEAVMQAISDVGVKRVRKTDRSVESYEIPDRIGTYSDPDSENEASKREERAKRFHLVKRPKPKGQAEKMVEERTLEDIEDDDDLTDEQLGTIIARALQEQKSELIITIVQVLGKELTLKLYRKTQLVESNGGVLVINGSRRRTSGGVFLYLLKTFEGVTKDHLLSIFLDDKNEQVAKKRKRKDNKKRKKSQNAGTSLKLSSEMEETTSKDFSEETGGIKCPGSTPVSSPLGSDNEENAWYTTSDPVHLVEACHKAAKEIKERIEF